MWSGTSQTRKPNRPAETSALVWNTWHVVNAVIATSHGI